MSAENRVPRIVGEGLTRTYRKRVVLDVPHIEIAPGSTYALLGASGAGKSTLMRLLGLLERPSTGRVLYDDVAVSNRDLKMRRRIAAVFQKPYLLRDTVEANAGYGLRLRHLPAVERRRRVASALDLVGLKGWESRSALTLSGGEAQRVALARALVIEPEFLLLDEPLSYLDPLLKRSLSVEFAQILATRTATALYVTHDQDEAAVVADTIGVMREGRLVTQGDPDTVLGLPADEWVAAFVDMEPPMTGIVVGEQDGVCTIDVGGTVVRASCSVAQEVPVVVAVRPEDVTVGGASATGDQDNCIPATVREIRPRGGSVQVVAQFGENRMAAMLSRTKAARAGISVGDTVTLSFPREAVRVRPQ